MTEMLSKAQIEDVDRQIDDKLEALASEILSPEKAEPLPTGLMPRTHSVVQDQQFLRGVSVGLLIATGEWSNTVRLLSGRDWDFQVLEEKGGQTNG